MRNLSFSRLLQAHQVVQDNTVFKHDLDSVEAILHGSQPKLEELARMPKAYLTTYMAQKILQLCAFLSFSNLLAVCFIIVFLRKSIIVKEEMW